MKKQLILSAIAAVALGAPAASMAESLDFNYKVDRFADIEVLRYKVPDFEQLTTQQKELVYYLTEAALYGRDILTDQNGKYNLAIRTTLENIYKNYDGSKDDADYKGFVLLFEAGVVCQRHTPPLFYRQIYTSVQSGVF